MEKPEGEAAKQEVVNPVAESQNVSAPPPVMEIPAVRPIVPEPKNFSLEEIRRVQLRLKDVGLDPGPANGSVGTKTRAAAQKLEAGCAELETLLRNYSADRVPDAKNAPGRQETKSLQTALRSAGFNPGPADGIFGNRTRLVLVQLQTLCPMSDQYAASFARTDSTKPAPDGAATARAIKAPAIVNHNKEESVKPVSALVPAPSQDEIRILQLRLRDAGFDPGPIDGVLGAQTKKAIQDYQAAQRAGKIKESIAAGLNVHY
jgi:peptidoglycan hydrolase-like protein with peptidoglycan-binding domain